MLSCGNGDSEDELRSVGSGKDMELLKNMEFRGVEAVEEGALGTIMLRRGLENTAEIRRDLGALALLSVFP